MKESYVSHNYTGHVHNARKATFDGRDLFVAAIHVDGKYRATLRDSVEEHESITEARAWCHKRLSQLGVDGHKVITVERT